MRVSPSAIIAQRLPYPHLMDCCRRRAQETQVSICQIRWQQIAKRLLRPTRVAQSWHRLLRGIRRIVRLRRTWPLSVPQEWLDMEKAAALLQKHGLRLPVAESCGSSIQDKEFCSGRCTADMAMQLVHLWSRPLATTKSAGPALVPDSAWDSLQGLRPCDECSHTPCARSLALCRAALARSSNAGQAGCKNSSA